ncbi:MAG: hypothetical protein ABW032_00990, partial [Burkholderiaceae bacterium]
MDGKLPEDAEERLKEAQLEQLSGLNLRPPLLLTFGEGGEGKTTLGSAIAFILGFKQYKIEAKDTTPQKLLGSGMDTLLERPGLTLEEVFGILPVIAMRSRYLDISFNFDNLDLDLFVPSGALPSNNRNGDYTPGQNAAAVFQELFDSDTTSMVFNSLGGLPLDARGWQMFASTNKAWPKLPVGSNSYRELVAFRSRIIELLIDISEPLLKATRLHALLDDLQLEPAHPLRRHVKTVAERDQHHTGARQAGRAVLAVTRLEYFQAGSEFFKPEEMDDLIAGEIDRKLHKSGFDSESEERVMDSGLPRRRGSGTQSVSGSSDDSNRSELELSYLPQKPMTKSVVAPAGKLAGVRSGKQSTGSASRENAQAGGDLSTPGTQVGFETPPSSRQESTSAAPQQPTRQPILSPPDQRTGWLHRGGRWVRATETTETPDSAAEPDNGAASEASSQQAPAG